MHLACSQIILLSRLVTFSQRRQSHITGALPITLLFCRSLAHQQGLSGLITASDLSKKAGHPIAVIFYVMLTVSHIAYDAGIKHTPTYRLAWPLMMLARPRSLGQPPAFTRSDSHAGDHRRNPPDSRPTYSSQTCCAPARTVDAGLEPRDLGGTQV